MVTSATILSLWKIPKEMMPEIKAAYANKEWLWLIKVWNDYQVSPDRLCPACPESIKVIRAHMPKYWMKKFSAILADKVAATLEELQAMYFEFYDGDMRAVQVLSERELKRVIAFGYYNREVVEGRKNRGMVLNNIATVTGLSMASLFSWFPPSTVEGE